MNSIFALSLLVVALIIGGFLISRMGSANSKYDRRAKSPWKSLTDGEDPTQ